MYEGTENVFTVFVFAKNIKCNMSKRILILECCIFVLETSKQWKKIKTEEETHSRLYAVAL